MERETVDFTFQRIEEFIVKQPSNVVPFAIDYVKIPSTDKEWRQEAIGSRPFTPLVHLRQKFFYALDLGRPISKKPPRPPPPPPPPPPPHPLSLSLFLSLSLQITINKLKENII